MFAQQLNIVWNMLTRPHTASSIILCHRRTRRIVNYIETVTRTSEKGIRVNDDCDLEDGKLQQKRVLSEC